MVKTYADYSNSNDATRTLARLTPGMIKEAEYNCNNNSIYNGSNNNHISNYYRVPPELAQTPKH